MLTPTVHFSTVAIIIQALPTLLYCMRRKSETCEGVVYTCIYLLDVPSALCDLAIFSVSAMFAPPAEWPTASTNDFQVGGPNFLTL